MRSIHVAESDDQISLCFPVMRQLREHLVESEFVETVRRQNRSGYFLAYLADEGVAVSAAGYRLIENLVNGNSLYVDDLVTLEDRRSRGYGKALFDWLVERARSEGCDVLVLDSGVQRYHAHRFYLANRMIISSHHLHLKL